MAGPLPKRIMWFVGIWIASVLSLTAVAYAIKLLVNP